MYIVLCITDFLLPYEALLLKSTINFLREFLQASKQVLVSIKSKNDHVKSDGKALKKII